MASKVSMQPPDGVSWRGWGRPRFLLPGLFWGLIRIKSAAAPRAPSSCAQQLSTSSASCSRTENSGGGCKAKGWDPG